MVTHIERASALSIPSIRECPLLGSLLALMRGAVWPSLYAWPNRGGLWLSSGTDAPDSVRDNHGVARLMEFELVEPRLRLDTAPWALKRLVRAIDTRRSIVAAHSNSFCKSMNIQ
jgi:hypothetical protein